MMKILLHFKIFIYNVCSHSTRIYEYLKWKQFIFHIYEDCEEEEREHRAYMLETLEIVE